MMEVIIGIVAALVVFILAIYRSGEKNGYFVGYKQGKEDAEKEYHKLIEDYRERDRRINFYQ